MPVALSSKALTSSSTVRSAVRPRAVRRSVKVTAKFDPKDMENTTGSWDMYGQDSTKRYPGLQATFFERAAEPLTRRESLLTFVLLSSTAACVAFGLKGAPAIDSPIVRGPQTSGESGKGGSVNNRL